MNKQLQAIEPTLLTDGIIFGEGPRWRNGTLYISDMLGKKIYAIDETGNKEVLVEVPNQPNGICFSADGTLIHCSMFDQKLYKVVDGKDVLHTDLSPLMTGYCGDIVMDATGRIYVDDVGARLHHGESKRPGRVIIVEQDGTIRTAVDNIMFPNGIVISPDGKTMLLGESHAHCITRFDIAPDGSLHNRSVWLDTFELIEYGVEGDRVSFPWVDGLVMDAEGGVWVSMLKADCFVRVDKNAKPTHIVRVQGDATACTLGGPDGKTLYMVCNAIPKNEDIFEAMTKGRSKGCVMTALVDVPKGNTRP